MGDGFAYWFSLFRRAGKLFSLSLTLGTDVVADIAEKLSTDMPPCRGCARCHHPSYFHPHGGPITHRSTGSKPDSPVHPLFPKLFLARGLVCNSRATFKSDIRHNTYSRCFEPLSRPIIGIEHSCPLETFHDTALLCSRYFLSFNSRVTFRHLPRCYRLDSQPYRGLFPWNNPLILP